MKKLGAACLAGGFVLLTSMASASDLRGFGTATCSQISSAWNGATTNDRKDMVLAIGQWTFGYLSGRNMEIASNYRKNLDALDNDDTALFIVTQCASLPNAYVVQIADAIYDALPYLYGSS